MPRCAGTLPAAHAELAAPTDINVPRAKPTSVFTAFLLIAARYADRYEQPPSWLQRCAKKGEGGPSYVRLGEVETAAEMAGRALVGRYRVTSIAPAPPMLMRRMPPMSMN